MTQDVYYPLGMKPFILKEKPEFTVLITNPNEPHWRVSLLHNPIQESIWESHRMNLPALFASLMCDVYLFDASEAEEAKNIPDMPETSESNGAWVMVSDGNSIQYAAFYSAGNPKSVVTPKGKYFHIEDLLETMGKTVEVATQELELVAVGEVTEVWVYPKQMMLEGFKAWYMEQHQSGLDPEEVVMFYPIGEYLWNTNAGVFSSGDAINPPTVADFLSVERVMSPFQLFSQYS